MEISFEVPALLRVLPVSFSQPELKIEMKKTRAETLRHLSVFIVQRPSRGISFAVSQWTVELMSNLAHAPQPA